VRQNSEVTDRVEHPAQLQEIQELMLAPVGRHNVKEDRELKEAVEREPLRCEPGEESLQDGGEENESEDVAGNRTRADGVGGGGEGDGGGGAGRHRGGRRRGQG